MYNFFLGFLSAVAVASLWGEVLGRVWPLPLSFTLIFGLWSLVPTSSRVINAKFFLFGLAFTLGIISLNADRQSSLVDFNLANRPIEGVVVDEPDERDRDTRLTFRPDNSRGKVLLIVATFPPYYYGDRLRVMGKLESPKTFETDGGRSFDYPAYLAVRGIGAIMYQPKVEKLGSGGSVFVAKLFQLKSVFLSQLDQVLPEPASSLLGGLVVGGKRSLGDLWQERLRRAGLIHLIVLSGYNLTIIGVAIASLLNFFRFRRSWSLALSALAIITFAVMVGGGASVIRATIMAIIAIVARLTGRVYEAGQALATAIVVMVIINPLILVYDIGFQLSCLATAGLIYGAPPFESWFKFLPARFGLRATVATTVAAQVAVLPLILYFMGQLPIYALLTNLLVVPLVPFTMLLAVTISLAGFIFSPLAYLIAPLGYLVAKYILIITAVGSALPGATVAIKSFPFVLVVIIYVGYFLIWRKKAARQEVRPRGDPSTSAHFESGR